jgi:hypothetical protein
MQEKQIKESSLEINPTGINIYHKKLKCVTHRNGKIMSRGLPLLEIESFCGVH